MRKKGYTVAAILCIFLLLCGTVRVAAATSSAKEPTEYVDDFANALPPELSDVGDAIKEGKLSEISDMAFLSSFLFDSLGNGLSSLRGQFSTLLLLLLLIALSASVKPEGKSGNAVELGVIIVAATVLYRSLYTVTVRVGAYLDDLCFLANTAMPVMSVLQTAGGNITGAAVGANGMSYFLLLLENLCRSVLLPLTNVSFGFVAVDALGRELSVGGILKTVRHLYMSILGFFSTLLCASLGMQNALSTASDSLLFKGARYAVGNLIPVVGGVVSNTLQTAAASILMLKQSVGVGCAVAILLLTLPLFLELFLTRTLISLSAGVSEMMDAPRANTLFVNLRGIYDMLIAMTLLPSLIFLFLAALFARTACAAA